MDALQGPPGIRNARQGVIYLWQGVDVESPYADLAVNGSVRAFTALANRRWDGFGDFNEAIGDPLTMFGSAAAGANGAGTGLAKVMSWATSFVAELRSQIAELFGAPHELISFSKNLALWVAAQVMDDADSLESVGDVANLWNAGKSFIQKLRSYVAGYNVKINYGHPATLVKGVESGMNRAMLSGVFELAKSSISSTLSSFGAFATKAVDYMAGIFEFAVESLWRYAEFLVLDKFTAKAKTLWAARGTASDLSRNNRKFNLWLRGAVDKVPLIAAVTLVSGLGGDKMRLLQMFGGGNTVISQSDFDSGVAYLDQLKRTAAHMMKDAELELDSDDPLIKSSLKMHETVIAAQQAEQGWWGSVSRFVDSWIGA
ncbi:hypothetical protein [Tropicimonas sp. IMCC34011]|uniref:hypothetical protein n=1 Tax=Tropicimonas sp. IMCC34011 TaxID=2248759 RepID=UPI000E22BFE9|nr:hypothetical protein [Tropicimonas sp. IMCC34011]